MRFLCDPWVTIGLCSLRRCQTPPSVAALTQCCILKSEEYCRVGEESAMLKDILPSEKEWDIVVFSRAKEEDSLWTDSMNAGVHCN